jgi:hypothetical protein
MLLRVSILCVAALAIAAGWYQMFRFSSTPGEQSAAPAHWPSDIPASLETAHALRDSGQPLLLVFVHPQCSCTHSTLRQLDLILESSPAKVQIALVIYRSKVIDQATGEAPELKSDNQARPAAFASAGLLHRPFRIVPDTDGSLARRFGAATSGEIVLYATGGRLLFQGGITAERAHVGDSTGGEALRTALDTGTAQGKRSSVFGCPIFLLGRAG